MDTITISDIKRHGAKSLSDTDTKILIVNSRPKSAVVPIKEYETYIEALEELADKRDIVARKNEPTSSLETYADKRWPKK